MVKATNPHTGKSEIVTPQQAEEMREGVACREYQFEGLEDPVPVEPPQLEPPEHLPTPPPAVNVPEPRSGPEKVTKAPKGRK